MGVQRMPLPITLIILGRRRVRGEPGILVKACKYLGRRRGESEVQEKSRVQMGMELPQEENFSAQFD